MEICARQNYSAMNVDIGKSLSSARLTRLLPMLSCRHGTGACWMRLTKGSRPAQEERQNGTTNHILNEGDDHVLPH